jgi:glutamate dehydrogenase
MGITARGAWESVQRTSASQLDVDADEDFTVVGIGDMSGDVFGNGMLLSSTLRLVAAFDHRHIFLDPTPTRPPLRRAAAAVRAAPLVLGGLRHELISAGGGCGRAPPSRCRCPPQARARWAWTTPCSS